MGILMTVYYTQCPFSKVTLCLTPSLIAIWLAVSLQCLPLSVDTLSRPLKRDIGRGVKRETLLHCFRYDTELKSIAESSNKKQTTCTQTDTTPLSAPNVSVARVCFSAKCHWQRGLQHPRHFFPERH